MKRFRAAVAMAILCGASLALAQSASPTLVQDDRIVFLGDSITELGMRTNGYVSLTKAAIRSAYPESAIDVIGAGISGHTVLDCQKRLDRDVLARKPTLVVVYIGINDVWRWARGVGTSREDYEAGLRDIISRIRETGARVILCTPTVIGERTGGANHLDSMLDDYCEISRRVARELQAELVDLRKAFVEYIATHNPRDLKEGILTADGVHMNDAGNRLLADQMLQALNVPQH